MKQSLVLISPTSTYAALLIVLAVFLGNYKAHTENCGIGRTQVCKSNKSFVIGYQIGGSGRNASSKRLEEDLKGYKHNKHPIVVRFPDVAFSKVPYGMLNSAVVRAELYNFACLPRYGLRSTSSVHIRAVSLIAPRRCSLLILWYSSSEAISQKWLMEG